MEFEGRKAVIAPEAVLIIGTYDENGVPNAMNAAWGTQKDPDEILIVLSSHKTTENFEKTGAFTVALGTADTESSLITSALPPVIRKTRSKRQASMFIPVPM